MAIVEEGLPVGVEADLCGVAEGEGVLHGFAPGGEVG